MWLVLAVGVALADPVVQPGADVGVVDGAPATQAAIELLRAERFDEAAAAFAELAAAAPSPQLAYLHALACYEGGALAKADTASKAVEDGDYAPLLNLKGLILADLGHGDEALAMLTRAESAAGDDRPLRARVLLNRGLVEADSGRFVPAETSLTRALELAREAGAEDVAAGALENLARVASLTGRGDSRDVLGAVVDKLRRGDLAGARAAVVEGEDADRRETARRHLAKAAILRVEGRMELALRETDEALRISRDGGLVRERLAALSDLAALHLALERPALAGTALDEAMALVGDTHFKVREVGLRIQAGFVAVEQGDADDAGVHAARARELLARSPQPVASARLAELDARRSLLTGDAAAADAAFGVAFDGLTSLGYHADASRVAVDAVRRTTDAARRAAWTTKADAAFRAAGDNTGPAALALSEGLALADAGDLEGAVAAFVRAAEGAADTGPRGDRIAEVARSNAATALVALGHSADAASSASTLGLADLSRAREVFVASEAAYERGRTAYDAQEYDAARLAFEEALTGFVTIGELKHANTARRARAWASYHGAVRRDAPSSLEFYEELEQEAIQVDDPELAVRARASLAITAATTGVPDAAVRLREAAARAEQADLPVVAGQVWAELALADGELDARAAAARKAFALLPGVDLGAHAMYIVAVAAYNAEQDDVSRALCDEALTSPGSLAEALGQLRSALTPTAP